MAKTFASSVPVHNLPVGKKGEKDSGGNLKFIGTYRGFFEVSTVMHFEERKRFPKELFLPSSPPATTYSPGLKTHNLPITIPNPDRPGGVLVPQQNPHFMAKLLLAVSHRNRKRIDKRCP